MISAENDYAFIKQRYLKLAEEFGWNEIDWKDYFPDPEQVIPKELEINYFEPAIEENDKVEKMVMSPNYYESSGPVDDVTSLNNLLEDNPFKGFTRASCCSNHSNFNGFSNNNQVIHDNKDTIYISDEEEEHNFNNNNTSVIKVTEEEMIESDDNEEEEEDEVYVVEKILDKRYNKKYKQNEYLVKWQGYSSKDNSWVREEDILDKKLIKKFEKLNKEEIILDEESSSEEEEELEGEEEAEFIDDGTDEEEEGYGINLDDEEEYVFDDEEEEQQQTRKKKDNVDKRKKCIELSESEEEEEEEEEFVIEDSPPKKKNNKKNTKSKTNVNKTIISISDDEEASNDDESDEDDEEREIQSVNKTQTTKKNKSTTTKSTNDKKQFIKKRDELLQKYYDEFNKVCFKNKLPALTVIDGKKVKEYKGKPYLAWNKNLRKTAGYCKLFTIRKMKPFSNEMITDKVGAIELSTKVCDCEERLIHTLAHEICHLASYLFDNVSGHGKTFYSYGNLIQKYYPNIPITTCHSYEIEYKYHYKCTVCGEILKRHSKSIDITKKCCGICKGKLELIKQPQGGKTGQVSAYNIFVKENYKHFKAKNPNASRGEIMKLVASAYKQSKQQ
ncbi:hypothetical protein ABK040_016251 [Willaertia magna]